MTPVVHAPRRCPIALKDEIKRELGTMEEMGVIPRVSRPTNWVSSLVYSRKSSGRLRICRDPKDLNLMQAAQKHGLVFNGDKCKIKTSKLHFFGLVFDANGVHPDPTRIDDFRSMTKQADADELREFIASRPRYLGSYQTSKRTQRRSAT